MSKSVSCGGRGTGLARSLAWADILVFMIRAAGSSSVYVGAVLRGFPRRADAPITFARFFGRRRLRGSISPAAVDSLAAAIQKQEGYFPGSLAYRNNNPGNLVYVGQPGASPGAGGFASFASYDLGLQALRNQITLDASRGTDVNGKPTTTVSELLSSWAPASENDTAGYIASVSAQTGFDPNAPLSSLGTDAASTPDVSVFPSEFAGSADLSAAGFGSVPLPVLVGAGLVGILALSRIF